MALTSYNPRFEAPLKRPPTGIKQASFISPCKIAILGFGTVGRAVTRILTETPHPSLGLTHIYNRSVQRKRESWVDEKVKWTDSFDDVLASDTRIVVELMGGLEPARSCIRQALLAGKSVVTANKHLIAKHGSELVELARKAGSRLEYGASVAGGVPVLCALQQGLAGDQLTKLSGVLNGTCNFILSNMESRESAFSDALLEAQRLGYAEANPADDVNGLDASCKLAILSRIALKVEIDPEQVATTPITSVRSFDFAAAKRIGCTIRQVSHGELNGRSLFASVGPALVKLDSPLARTYDNQNAVVTWGKYGGETVLSGCGAGGGPTAVAVVSDLLAIARRVPAPDHINCDDELVRLPLGSDFSSEHYLRLSHGKMRSVSQLIRQKCKKHGITAQSIARQNGGSANVQSAFVLSQCLHSVATAIVDEVREQNRFLQPLLLPIR